MRKVHVVAVVVVVAVAVSLAVTSVRLDSATSDEPAYLAAGLVKLQHGWLSFFRDQPPLMNVISALPVSLAGYRLTQWAPDANHWRVGRIFLYRSGHDAYRLLFLARLPTIVVFAALCIAVYVAVLHWSGSWWSALTSLLLTAFCPNLMAHGRLATVDAALAFFLFVAAALMVRLVERPGPAVAAELGVVSAAAVMTKASANIIGPYFVVVLTLALLTKTHRRAWRRLLVAFGLAIVAAIVTAEVVILSLASEAYLRAEAAGVPRVAVPFLEYAANLRKILGWYSGGHDNPQFLLGEFSRTGWRSYYFVAFILKTTLPAVVLTIAAIVAFGGRAWRERRELAPGTFAALALLLFVALFVAAAAAGELALGIRYVLPIYPFLYAVIGIVVAQSAAGAERSRALAAGIALLLFWHVAENVRAYPAYISYFNQLIGSHRNADKFLIDSNLDWGQDLRRLDLWCRDNGVKSITVHYFGGADVGWEMRHARPTLLREPGHVPLPKGWFALSRHLYRASFDGRSFPVDYDTYLEGNKAEYVTTVGGSIDVYRLD